MPTADAVFVDAGLFIGALLGDAPRHAEALPLVESARRGEISCCTSAGVLAEVYAALTWAGAQPAQPPDLAAEAVRLLVMEPSNIRVLDTGHAAALKMLDLTKRYALTGRRVHDARHAATALEAGVHGVFTYEVDDWRGYCACRSSVRARYIVVSSQEAPQRETSGRSGRVMGTRGRQAEQEASSGRAGRMRAAEAWR